MQVFNCFFKIVKKNMLAIMIYCIVFLGLSIVISMVAVQNDTKEFEKMKIKVSVIDRDQSELSKALTNYIGKKHTLVEMKDDKEAMQDNLFARAVEYILIIPQDFQKKMENKEDTHTENIKVPGSYSGYFLDNQISQYLKSIRTYQSLGMSTLEASANAAEDMEMQGQVSMQDETVKANMPSIYYYFLYLPYAFLAIFINGIGPVLIAFQKKDIKKRNDCSAMSLLSRNKQLILGNIVFAAVVWLIFMLAATLLYKGEIFEPNIKYALINTIAFLLLSASIAYLVGMNVKNSESMSMIVNSVSLGLCFLGGIFVPQEVMSEKVLAFSRFIPSYWYVKVNSLLGNTSGISSTMVNDVWIGILIQVGFAVAIFAITLVLLKRKRYLG